MSADPDRHRHEAEEANEAMKHEFNDEGSRPKRRDEDNRRAETRPLDADDITGKAAERANAAARVRKPFP
jgi:hypothetical protein